MTKLMVAFRSFANAPNRVLVVGNIYSVLAANIAMKCDSTVGSACCRLLVWDLATNRGSPTHFSAFTNSFATGVKNPEALLVLYSEGL